MTYVCGLWFGETEMNKLNWVLRNQPAEWWDGYYFSYTMSKVSLEFTLALSAQLDCPFWILRHAIMDARQRAWVSGLMNSTGTSTWEQWYFCLSTYLQALWACIRRARTNGWGSRQANKVEINGYQLWCIFQLFVESSSAAVAFMFD